MNESGGRSLHEKLGFELTVAAVITANAALSGYTMFAHVSPHVEHALEYVETAFLVFFVLEMLLRIKHHGRAFFRSWWSWADMVIIGLALLPTLGVGVAVLRAGRLARLVHVARHISGLRVVRLLALLHWRWTTRGQGAPALVIE